MGFYDSPRYSTGYNALFDRIGILAESHMLKPYPDRVNATFQLMLATLAVLDRHGDKLVRERMAAKNLSASMDELGMNWRLDTSRVERIPWKGYGAVHEPSPVSGLPVLGYDRSKPTATTVPWMDTYRPSLIKQKPMGYLIPRAWREIGERLRAHGVDVVELPAATAYNVEADSIVEYKTTPQPSEGHYLHREIRCTTRVATHVAQIGDLYVRTGQVEDRFVMEALEPEGEDSYFAWGFFDAILQQKEWYNPYLFEPIAAELLAKDPELRADLAARRASDEVFAKDASAQLHFVFQRSPYADAAYRKYPVLRIVGH